MTKAEPAEGTDGTEAAAAGRWAVYHAPRPGGAWWLAGSRWLGRSADGAPVPAPQVLPSPIPTDVDASTFARITAEPRRYGWHATLKAPFALAPGVSPDELRQAMGRLARDAGRDITAHCPQHGSALPLSPLAVTRLGQFLALVPAGHGPGEAAALQALAARCVTQLQPLAAPLTPTQLERRRRAGLSPEEDALMLRWGYPYVLERFRFHISLTGSLGSWLKDSTDGSSGSLDAGQIDALQAAAQAWFEPLPALQLDSLSLFHEAAAGEPFRLVEQWEIGT